MKTNTQHSKNGKKYAQKQTQPKEDDGGEEEEEDDEDEEWMAQFCFSGYCRVVRE